MGIDIGDAVPDLSLLDDTGASVSTAELFAGTTTVVFFYPKAMTPGCTAEACGFRDRHQPFLDRGYQIVGASPDAPEANAAFRERDRLPFPLLSDESHEFAAALGAWGIKKNYGKEYEGLIRSTFVIDDGVITHAWRNVRAKGHVDRVAAALDIN